MAGNQREVAVAEYLAMRAQAMTEPGSGRCSFSYDPEEDARIKDAIRGYVNAWVLPYATALGASLRGTATAEQLALLDDVKTRGY